MLRSNHELLERNMGQVRRPGVRQLAAGRRLPAPRPRLREPPRGHRWARFGRSVEPFLRGYVREVRRDRPLSSFLVPLASGLPKFRTRFRRSEFQDVRTQEFGMHEQGRLVEQWMIHCTARKIFVDTHSNAKIGFGPLSQPQRSAARSHPSALPARGVYLAG